MSFMIKCKHTLANSSFANLIIPITALNKISLGLDLPKYKLKIDQQLYVYIQYAVLTQSYTCASVRLQEKMYQQR